MNKKGFTLIEFIIVISIIGILVLLAAPKFMNYIRDAKLTQIKNDTRVVEDVLLAEQAKLLIEDKDVDKYLIKNNTQDKGIAKDNKELINIDQGEGIQINTELIKKHTNTKLNPEGFYFNKDHNKVFYYNQDNNNDDIDKDSIIIKDSLNPQDPIVGEIINYEYVIINNNKSKSYIINTETIFDNNLQLFLISGKIKNNKNVKDLNQLIQNNKVKNILLAPGDEVVLTIQFNALIPGENIKIETIVSFNDEDLSDISKKLLLNINDYQ